MDYVHQMDNLDLMDFWKWNIRNHYFKPENKNDNSDFTIFGMKIGHVPDLQELP